ncbi:MAG: hypothetical protein JWP44_4499, partial [Mucilaginibacter sp.]|nr:hypothetical protein [Mucilaginibacter sp.]
DVAHITDYPKVLTHEGVDIHVTDQGMFCAMVKGRLVNRAQLSDLKKLVAPGLPAVDVVTVDNSFYGLRYRKHRVASLDRAGRFRFEDGRPAKQYERYYLATPAELAVLDGIAGEYETLRTRWEAAIEKMERLTPNTLRTAQEAQEAGDAS